MPRVIGIKPSSVIVNQIIGWPRKWMSVLLIAALPPLLAVLGYVRPVLLWDSIFYGYQLKHVGELNGRWWKVGEDPLLGHPYQNEIANHAGLYEGVDLMLISAWPSHFLDPRQTYYFAACVALAINGWVAGWLALRMTRSLLWSTLAIVLITWNVPTANRFLCHLHLFKYGWVLLAIYAFSGYLQKPDLRRGIWLGGLVALALQGSFYLGYLLLLALGTWWVGCLIAKKIGREHGVATCAAGLTFAIVGFALTFPVWTIAKARYFSDDYFQRRWLETWFYGAELWQYLVPEGSPSALDFIAQVNVKSLGNYREGWNFPGYTILLAVGLYLVARLRGWKLWESHARLLDRLVGLMGIFVVLSLSGGPSYFLFQIRPLSCFRCYGRAGLLALAVGCVAAPLIYHGLIGALRPRWLRVVAMGCVVALVAFDGRSALKTHDPAILKEPERIVGPAPAWSDWLAQQPFSVHLAAFTSLPPKAPLIYLWGFDSSMYRLKHGHATLNGCSMRLLQGDLNLLGASYDRMNAAGLRFVVALGYETLAFDQQYLKTNPWIKSLPWLDWLEERGGWSIARANQSMPPFQRRSLLQVLAEQPKVSRERAVEVPAGTWITGQLEVSRDTVVADDSQVFMTWAKADGTLRGKPLNALFQHVFGTSIPSFRIRTPSTPGDYELVFLDRQRRRLAAMPYRVSPALRTSRGTFGGRIPEITINAVTAETEAGGPDPLRLVIENTTALYLPTLFENPGTCRSICAQPGLVYPGPGSLRLWMHVDEKDDLPPQDLNFTLPRDLPPHGKLTLELPSDRIAGAGRHVRFTVTPNFGRSSRMVSANAADVRISLTTGHMSQLARPDDQGAEPEAKVRR